MAILDSISFASFVDLALMADEISKNVECWIFFSAPQKIMSEAEIKSTTHKIVWEARRRRMVRTAEELREDGVIITDVRKLGKEDNKVAQKAVKRAIGSLNSLLGILIEAEDGGKFAFKLSM